MRKRVEKADIIFMPYNYLIGQQSEFLKNAVVIIDEAHNMPQMLEE
jgi:Rad3-related DNA helicase